MTQPPASDLTSCSFLPLTLAMLGPGSAVPLCLTTRLSALSPTLLPQAAFSPDTLLSRQLKLPSPAGLPGSPSLLSHDGRVPRAHDTACGKHPNVH